MKVSIVEVNGVELPAPMMLSMTHQAATKSDRRAKVICAKGRFDDAYKSRQDTRIITLNPMARRMLCLQILSRVASSEEFDDQLTVTH